MAKGVLSTPFINGYEYSWGNIQILISGTPVIGATAVEYSENADVQKLYGAGRQAIAYGVANYEAEASITVLASEVLALQESARIQGIIDGNIMGLTPFDIVVSYIPSEGQGVPKFDILKNCLFTKNERSISQGDASIEVTLDIVLSHIVWGDL
jgi:hypothetical protein